MSFEIYSVTNYATSNNDFIKNKKIIFYSIDKLIEELEKNDKFYHFRIHNNHRYIFFGDLDNYNQDIAHFKEILISFLYKKYDIIIDDIDFKYTKNDKKNTPKLIGVFKI